jgi:uncharacterized membrane protein
MCVHEKGATLFSHYIFWPWFAGLVFLLAGVVSARREFIAAEGLGRVVVLGPAFAASALACFGAEHMVNIGPFSQAVPRWLPLHAFWIVFFGIALLASALSLVLNKATRLSAMLTALMFVIFVLSLHLPEAIASPHDRFRWTVVLRETSFAAGFIAFAGAHRPRSKPLILIGRICAALPYLFFTVMHILHPQNAPGVPLAKLSPPWLFWPHVWATVTAAFLTAAAITILLNWNARTATTWLGSWILLLTLIVYLPMLIPAKGGAQLIEAVNYIFDTLLFSGTILLLASALPVGKVPVRETKMAMAA